MKVWLRRVVYLLLFVFVLLNILAAFHAYKFTHFYNEEEVAVKKPEQMNGWEKAKTILFGVNYTKRSITTVPAHPYKNFTTTTSDGLQLQGWYIPSPASRGAVIMLHGHGSTRSGVAKEADAFYDLGYTVYMIDLRAHGNSDGNVCTIGYKETADVKAVYDYVTSKGETNIVLWGISLGAATIAKTLVDYPGVKPNKVILEMPFGSLSEAVEGRLRIMHLPEEPLATLLTFWGGTEHGFWAFGLNPSTYVKSIKVPVLMQWGKNDKRVTEKETREVFNNISSSNKQLVVYENSGHESLLQKEPVKWVTTVTAFLSR
jgi:uncharacterized protein